MTTQTASFTSDGTFTAPATLIRGGVTFNVWGAPGQTVTPAGGAGALCSGGLTMAANGTLSIYCGDYHLGGGTVAFSGAGNGGGSSAIVQGGVLQVEAGGGGGGSGGSSVGGTGGQPGGNGGANGAAQPAPGPGGGANSSTPGSGGAANGFAGSTNGTNGSFGGAAGSTNGGTGGNTAGGGGGGGYAGGGGGGGYEAAGGGPGGAGGGGGSSYIGGANVQSGASIAGGQSTGFGSVQIFYTFEDPPLTPTLTAPVNNATAELATTPVFGFTYRPGLDTGAIQAWMMRRKVASGAVALTVAAGSNGVNVTTFAGAGTLNIAGTNTTWDSSGLLTIATSGGTAVLSYTGKTGSTFTGVNLVSGTGTLATGGAVTRSAGPYEYFNVTTGFWNNVAPVLNSSGAAGFVVGTGTSPACTYTFAANKWTDGCVYNWSFATQETSTYNLQGPFATDFTVTAQAAPVITITSPPAISNVIQPVVIWTFAGTTQTNYRVVYYTAAQAAIGGFSPGISPSTFDTGNVLSAVTSFTTPLGAVVNGVTYVIYVQVTETGGITSNWVSTTTTINIDGPAGPTLVAIAGNDPNTNEPFVTLTASPNENHLSAVDSSFEGGIGTWIAVTNAAGTGSMTSTSAQALDQSHSLELASTAAGTMTAGTATGAGGYAVTPGQSYCAMAWLRAAASPRSSQVEINWYQSGGAASAIKPQSFGTLANDSTSTWTQYTVTDTAPSDAAFAQVRVNITATGAANEIHYVDQAGLFVAIGPPTWSIGGFLNNWGQVTAEFQASSDASATWADLRFGASVAFATPGWGCLDYESVPTPVPSYNLLTPADASFPSAAAGVGSWTPAANCTLARTTTPSLGGGTLAITSTSTSFSTQQGSSPATATAVTAGLQYSAYAAVRAAATPRGCQLSIQWTDAYDNVVGTSAGSIVADTVTGWTRLRVTGTAPAGAVYASIVLSLATSANGEVHYLDQASFLYTPVVLSSFVWTPGGDGAQAQYRVRLVDTSQNPAVPGLWSNIAIPTPPPTTNFHWIIKDPTVPGSGVQFDLQTDWKPRVHEEAQRYWPLGRAFGVKSSDGMKGIGGQIETTTTSIAAWQALMALLATPSTKLLQSPWAQWYISTEGDTIGDYLLSTFARQDFSAAKHLITYVQAQKP